MVVHRVGWPNVPAVVRRIADFNSCVPSRNAGTRLRTTRPEKLSVIHASKLRRATDGFAATMNDLKRTILERKRPFAAFCMASILSLLLAGCWPDAAAVTPPPAPPKVPNVVRVTTENLHQIGIVNVELVAFPN